MSVIVGTSGYSYKEWKGIFYPPDLPAAKMLSFYAEHFGTVEINNTFYRMPEAKTLEKWAGEVPDGFTFVIKAPQRITHQKRLDGVDEDVRHLVDVCSLLGPKLGPFLFQLPPYFRRDVGKLRHLLSLVPQGRRVAFEVRNDTWLVEETYDVLAAHDAALCLADTDEVPDPDALIVRTASWGYLRLRRLEYTDDELMGWKERIAAQGWTDTYLFFKHEDEARGPAFARRFLALR